MVSTQELVVVIMIAMLETVVEMGMMKVTTTVSSGIPVTTMPPKPNVIQ